MSRLAQVAVMILMVWGTVLSSSSFGQATDAERRQLDAQAAELRESIRQLELVRNRLGSSAEDNRKRQQIQDLLSRKREELRAVESLRASVVGGGNPATVERNQGRLLDAEIRSTREEIEALEKERNRLGYSGDDVRRRRELDDLIGRKRERLRSDENLRISAGHPQTQEQREKRALDAEIRELNEEIRVLERERNRLGSGGDDARRRQAINDLLSRKRELLRVKERERALSR
jgi:hypothetical protein